MYILIVLWSIRFRRAWRVQGHSLEELPFKAMGGVWGSWLGLLLIFLVLIAQFYVVSSTMIWWYLLLIKYYRLSGLSVEFPVAVNEQQTFSRLILLHPYYLPSGLVDTFGNARYHTEHMRSTWTLVVKVGLPLRRCVNTVQREKMPHFTFASIECYSPTRNWIGYLDHVPSFIWTIGTYSRVEN